MAGSTTGPGRCSTGTTQNTSLRHDALQLELAELIELVVHGGGDDDDYVGDDDGAGGGDEGDSDDDIGGGGGGDALLTSEVLGPGWRRRAETAPAAQGPRGSVSAVDLARGLGALLPGLYATARAVHQGLQGAPQPGPARRARAPPCACVAPMRCYARRHPPRRAVLADARPSRRSYPRTRAFVSPSARARARAPVATLVPPPPTSPRGPRALPYRHARDNKQIYDN
jgi:hypothetical protein